MRTLKKASNEMVISYYVLLGCPLAIYIIFLILPIAISLILGFTTWNLYQFQTFSGFANYKKIFSNVQFWWALWHNAQIVLISLFGQIPLALFLAYSIHRKIVRGGKFFTTMIFLPIVTSSVVVALLWNRIFSPVGLYTSLVRLITGDIDYVVSIFENKQLAMLPILFVILWMHTSVYLVIFLANLRRIPPAFIEAAIIDGASEWCIFTKIVIPILSNVIFTCAILGIAGSLKSFELIFAMTGGGPVDYTNVLAIYMYDKSFNSGNLGYGNAVSMIIALLSIGFIALLKISYHQFKRYSI